MDRCKGCGVALTSPGICGSCSWQQNMMETARMAEKMAKKGNLALWADGGCLGCNTKKRRITFIVIAVIFVVVGAVEAILDFSANQNIAYGCFGAGGLFLASAFICPDGFCGMYRNKNANGNVNNSNRPLFER